MDRQIYYKYLFFIGALWNWGASLPFVIITLIDKTALEPLGLAFPGTVMWFQGFLLAVTIFGLGYFLVSRDLENRKDLVILGLIGKLLVFIFFVAYYLAGEIPFTLLLMGTVDLIFSILFIEYLIHTKPDGNQPKNGP